MNKKYVVITGVSSGIGRAFVEKALESNRYIVLGMGRKNVADFKHKDYFFIETDLSDVTSVKGSFLKLKKRLKRVDVLINNAGFAFRSTIEDLSANEIKEQFGVNLIGPIYLTSLILPLMRKQKSGHIINISSVGSIVSTPTLGYYGATKSAFDKLGEVLEQEVVAFNIKVSTLFPGAVKSDFGKNIMLPANYSKSSYKSVYDEWKNRFANFFSIRNRADEAAEAILDLIAYPKRVKYLHIRDQALCLAKRLLPYQAFQFLFLNYFYKYES